MAAESLLVRQSVSSGVPVAVVRLVDRRPNAAPESQEWAFQREVEAALYGNGYSQQTGAVYRLLQRSGVRDRALPLKKACISQGLVTQAEFDFMYQHLCDVRSFTLIPLDALSTALSRYGCDERSEALVAALGLQRPDDWPAEEEHDDGGGGDGDGDGGGGGGGGGGDGDGDEGGDAGSGAGDVGGGDGNGVGGSAAGDASSDNVSVAGTEVMDEPPVVDEPQEVMACAVSISGHAAKRQRVDRHAHELSPALEAQLAAFEVHRSKPLNPWREGVVVATATIQSDRARVVRFMNWLMSKYTFIKLPPTLAILLHPNFGTVAKRNVEELAAEKPTSWLDWDTIQRVRVAAEEALAAAKFNADKLKLTRDVTVLRLLADQPPDRVGVVRLLKLGASLKRKANGIYELDLSKPGAHKTSAVFGATRTSINASITPWLDRYIKLASIPPGGYLFHSKGDTFEVVPASTWTDRVKAIFARHGDVALCPKDARSSFITFLRSGDHDDETVKAAAIAMRHSSKIQASAAYNKGASDRRVSAAMKVVADYSAKFTAGASTSTNTN